MKRIVFSKVRTLHNKDFSATMYEARVYLGSLFFDIGNLLCSASLGPYSGWQVPETFGIFWAVHILVQGKMTFSTSISVMDTLLSLVRVATKKLTENPGLFRTFQDSFQILRLSRTFQNWWEPCERDHFLYKSFVTHRFSATVMLLCS